MELLQAGAPAPLTHAILAAVLAISVVTDLQRRKIHDRVTLPCMMAGVLLHTLFGGLAGTATSAAGVATVVGLALAATLLAGRGLGGGDVKLLAAIGALEGPEFALWTCAYTALSGPILCLLPLLRSRLLRHTLRNFAQNATSRFAFGLPVDIAAGSVAGKQPFSIAIAAGAILTLLFR